MLFVGVIDLVVEKVCLFKDVGKLEVDILKIEKKFGNLKFVEKVLDEVVVGECEKVIEVKEKLDKISVVFGCFEEIG